MLLFNHYSQGFPFAGCTLFFINALVAFNQSHINDSLLSWAASCLFLCYHIFLSLPLLQLYTPPPSQADLAKTNMTVCPFFHPTCSQSSQSSLPPFRPLFSSLTVNTPWHLIGISFTSPLLLLPPSACIHSAAARCKRSRRCRTIDGPSAGRCDGFSEPLGRLDHTMVLPLMVHRPFLL